MNNPYAELAREVAEALARFADRIDAETGVAVPVTEPVIDPARWWAALGSTQGQAIRFTDEERTQLRERWERDHGGTFTQSTLRTQPPNAP